jgi:flagellar assembly protein FliH
LPPQNPGEPQSDQYDDRPDLSSAVEALRQLGDEIAQAQQNWLARSEDHVVRVAVAIAERIIRRELQQDPKIPLILVREAMELAAGNSLMRVVLNPADFQALGARVHDLAQAFARNSQVEVTQDEQVTAGGCRVDTRWGTIDQTIEAQLSRITEELLADD